MPARRESTQLLCGNGDFLLSGLRVWKLIQGVRSSPPGDLQALSLSFSRFSRVCSELGDLVAEMDVNPVIVSPAGALAVDTSLVLK